MVRNNYYSDFAQFMSFMDGIEYPRNDNSHVFPQERLLEITDLDVVSYFNFKAYHNANPSSPSDQPIYCRSSTLEYKKKAISSFLPHQNMPWDDITQKGNPTRSRAVHHMIQKVKVHEVRGTGVKSNARRAVEWEEFVNVLVAVREIYSESKEYSMLMALSVLTLQWQLIGRIDDIMQLRTSTVLFNVRDSFTLHIKMSWSKNIRTEMQSPTQLLLAAMDPIICPLLNLAVFIETFGGHGGLMFDRAKKTTTNLIDVILASSNFRAQRAGRVGTHSFRKGSATFASRFGLPKDWVNLRGRWRGKKKQVDTYIDVDQPYPDARVAAVLCGPRGPCKYAVKAGMVVPAAFLDSIVPHCCAAFGTQVARVLALPLLWAAYEREAQVSGAQRTLIPIRLAEEIQLEWIHAGGIPDVNPVEKIGLAVVQNREQMCLVPLRAHRHDNDGNEGAIGMEEPRMGMEPAGGLEEHGTTGTPEYDGRVSVLTSQLFLLQNRVEDLKNELSSILADHKRYMVNMNTNVRRIATQPVVRAVVPTSEKTIMSKLTKSPSDLFVLWREYDQGLDGGKAAKDYTAVERGRNKHTYSRRRVFWDAVVKLMARGYMADSAIDRISGAYGRRLSVTQVINQMKKDRMLGIVVVMVPSWWWRRKGRIGGEAFLE